MHSVIDLSGFPTRGSCWSGELCSLYNRNPVWCCSEHYLWLWVALMGVSTWRHILQCIVIVRPFLRLLNYVSLQSAKLISRCHDVLDHGLNLHRNIPLITVKATKWKPSLPLLSSPLSCSKWSECVPRSKRLEIRVSIMVASVHLHASPPPSKVPSKVGVWLGKHFTDDSII